MKISNLSILIIGFLIITMSCDDDSTVIPTPSNNDCVFVQNDEDEDGWISDSERSIMTDCTENALTSISIIEEILIGEWKLIGHGEGWIPTVSQPCAYIVITEDDLTLEFKNAYIDTTTTHLWEIRQIDWSGGTYYSLEATPGFEGLYITEFCDNYMYGDATPSDGNMYLYEKMK